MNIRKIAVVGGFAVGAALTLAPLASADTLTDAVDSEIASLNTLFVSEATLAGDGTDVVTHAGSFDTIPLSFAPDTGTPTFLDYELYGLNPIANAASDPGSYSVFNGALTEFSDAYNVELFSLANPTAAIDTIPAADLFGSATTIADALGTGTATGAITEFLTVGWSDLLGYL
jgi:hypothetical protein